MENNVCVIFRIFLVILTSVLTRADNDVSKRYPPVKIECVNWTPDRVLMMRIDVVTENKSDRLAWISSDYNIEVNYNNVIQAVPHASGLISQHPARFSIVLTDFRPKVDSTFNCSITATTKDADTYKDSVVIDPQFFDGQNFEKSVDNYCASEDTNPLLIAVIILAVIVLFLAFVTIKFICLDQGRCRALYSPMLPSYSHHTYSQNEDYNYSQGKPHYSVAWSGRSTTASSKKGGSRMMLGSSKSLSKSNFPYRAHNGSVRSMPPRMPQPPPPPPPPLPRDGPPKKLPAHQSNGSLQSSVTYALPQDAIDEELPTPPQDAIDQELPALPQDVTELGLPATGEEDGTDVSSEHYKVPKDSSVNRLSCSL